VSHPWPRHLNSGGNLSDAGDAAFDQGLVSFAEDGAVLAGRPLSEAARKTWMSMQHCRFAASATRIEQISGCVARTIDFRGGRLQAAAVGKDELSAVIPIRRQEIYGRSKSGRVRRSNHRISLHTPDGMLGRATFVAVQ
jgi:hypothetical protein